MKNTFTFVALAMLWLGGKSQSIIPDPNSTYCPDGSTITFKVSLTGANLNNFMTEGYAPGDVSGSQAIQNVSGPTVQQSGGTYILTFTGRFQDIAAPQYLRVGYYDATGKQSFYTAHYDKITSLNTGTSSNAKLVVHPNMLTWTVPACTTQNGNISFTAVTYVNNYVGSSPLTYGTVSNYQYLLPQGWSIDGKVSDGLTWISSSNATMISSDAIHGDGGSIQIRASPCAAGLAAGPASSISISRPNTSLSITASDNSNFMCSGSKLFTVNGVPTGASITWSIDNTNVATISGGNTNSVTVTKVNKGIANLTATITDCTGSRSVSASITMSAPPMGSSIAIRSYSNMILCDDPTSFKVLLGGGGSYAYNGVMTAGDNDDGPVTYRWSDPNTGSITMYYDDLGNGSVSVGTKTNQAGRTLRCKVTNGCGSAYKDYYFSTWGCMIISALPKQADSSSNHAAFSESKAVSGRSGNTNVSIFPNPAHDILHVTLPSSFESSRAGIIISDSYGRIVKRITAVNQLNDITIGELTPGLYFVEIMINNKIVNTEKIVKF